MSEPTTTSPVVPDWTRGWRLRRALEYAGIGVAEMADELGVSRQTLTRWMHNDGVPIRSVYLKQWALRCGVPLEWITEGSTAGYEDDKALAELTGATWNMTPFAIAQ